MNKITGYLLMGSAVLVFCKQVSAAEDLISLDAELYASSEGQQFAAAQFLPEVQEKEFGFATHNLNNNYNTGTCDGYNYTVFNCPPPKIPSNPCPFNKKKYKKCGCDEQVYKYSALNCVYKAQSPYYPDANRLLADTCRDAQNGALKAKECGCKYFRFTTNSSCGDADKVVDTRSSCQEGDGEVRYEACRCNREIYPNMFIGLLHSQAFKDEVKRVCGDEKSYSYCQNFSNEIHYKCTNK